MPAYYLQTGAKVRQKVGRKMPFSARQNERIKERTGSDQIKTGAGSKGGGAVDGATVPIFFWNFFFEKISAIYARIAIVCVYSVYYVHVRVRMCVYALSYALLCAECVTQYPL